MSRTAAIACILLALPAVLARAGAHSAVDELVAQLNAIDHLQGRFEQRQYGEDDTLLGESSGMFRLLRGGYFSWEITSPDRQLIIANPQYIWHYDKDLQTVSRRPIQGSAAASPLQILGGDEGVVREQFEVQQESPNDFILRPVAGEQGFKQLRVTFDRNAISGMDILDTLNQRVVVTFTELDDVTVLTDADFDFTPPPGDVDLFYYDE